MEDQGLLIRVSGDELSDGVERHHQLCCQIHSKMLSTLEGRLIPTPKVIVHQERVLNPLKPTQALYSLWCKYIEITVADLVLLLQVRKENDTMWVDTVQAAIALDMDLGVLRRLIKGSKNPPPFVRPSERSMLFDVDKLREWQKTWAAHPRAKATK